MASEPLRTYRYTLTAADALGWELLPREYTGWQKFGFVALLFVGGVGLGLLPEGWTEGWRFYAIGLAMVALVYLCAIVVSNLSARRRARRRCPTPRQLLVEVWGDHLAVTEDGRQRFIAFETIPSVSRDKARLYLGHGDDLLIIPASVFEPGESEALELAIDEADREP